MRTLQLAGTGSATASAVANVTIPSAAKIRGALIAVAIDSVTDNSRLFVECSKIPTSQLLTNGSQEPFLVVGAHVNVGAAGVGFGQINQFVPLDVDARQGEIVYLHVQVTGTLAYWANIILVYG